MNLGHAIGSAVKDAVRQPTYSWHALGEIVIEQVREVITELDPIRFERWEAADDERTCPICGRIDGYVWEEGEGFHPPVHDLCRCTRVFDHVEFRVRYIEVWRDRARLQTRWEWRSDNS